MVPSPQNPRRRFSNKRKRKEPWGKLKEQLEDDQKKPKAVFTEEFGAKVWDELNKQTRVFNEVRSRQAWRESRDYSFLSEIPQAEKVSPSLPVPRTNIRNRKIRF